MFIYLLYLFNHPSKSLIIPWVIKMKIPYFPNHISKSLIIPWEIKMINCKTRRINGLIWIPVVLISKSTVPAGN